MSHTFLYVLAVAGPEDLVKIGITRDPLARWSAFHPRWFEEFNLHNSLLVETDTRQEAQRIETRMHRALREHACPMPLTFSHAAGGRTEWFRGVTRQAYKEVGALRAAGFVSHLSAHPFIARQMSEHRHRIFDTVAGAYARHLDGTLPPAAREALRHGLDAHRTFGADLTEILTPEMRTALNI